MLARSRVSDGDPEEQYSGNSETVTRVTEQQSNVLEHSDEECQYVWIVQWTPSFPAPMACARSVKWNGSLERVVELVRYVAPRKRKEMIGTGWQG